MITIILTTISMATKKSQCVLDVNIWDMDPAKISEAAEPGIKYPVAYMVRIGHHLNLAAET